MYVVNYKYDGLGRRIEKEITETAVTNVTQYIYDNEDILLELDGSNNIIARYTHGPGIDEPLILENSGVSFFYHTDGLGSITDLTDTTGASVQSYAYSSFGKIELEQDPAFVQPYAFAAREFDPETSLYFYRARTYDSSVGRFLQVDPIGFSGGINLYAYVANNPINVSDPFGLIGLKEVIRRPGVQALGGAVIALLVEELSGKLCPGVGRGLVNLVGFVVAARTTATAVNLSVGFGITAAATTTTVVGSVVSGALSVGFAALAVQQFVTATQFLEQAFEDFGSSGEDCDLVCMEASTN